MADVVLRDVDPEWLKRLEERAEANGRSVEEEVRAIVEKSVPPTCGMETLRRLSRESHELFRGRTFSDSTDDIREDRER